LVNTSISLKIRLALLFPVTSKRKEYPFDVVIPKDLVVNGVILSYQVKSMDWRVRNAGYAASLLGVVMDEILSKLSSLLFE
jgi:mRNA interferase MazF